MLDHTNSPTYCAANAAAWARIADFYRANVKCGHILAERAERMVNRWQSLEHKLAREIYERERV